MTIAATGTLTSSTNVNPIPLNPAAVGNFYIVTSYCNSTTEFVTAISGGNCTWTPIGTPFTNATFGGSVTSWLGVATATGSASATQTFGNGTPSSATWAAQQFTTTAGSLSFDTQAGLFVAAPGTDTMPSLTPARAGELYWAHTWDSGTATAGTTPGYTYGTTPNGGICFNPACTTAAQAPVFGDSGHQFGLAILVAEVPAIPPPAHPVIARRASARGAWRGYVPVTVNNPAYAIGPPALVLAGSTARLAETYRLVTG